MPLRQPYARVIAYQVAVIEVRSRKPERSVKKNLPCSGRQEVRTPHDFGNPHSRIVDDHGQLVSRNIIAPPNDEVSKITPSDQALWAEMHIGEANPLAVGHSKPPIHSLGRLGPRSNSRLGCPTLAKRS